MEVICSTLKCLVRPVLAAFVTACLAAAMTPDVSAQPLPETSGAYPVLAPHYDGVEHLLFLSDRWVVVVTSTLEEVVEEIDAIAGGSFLDATERWDLTKNSPYPDWLARNTIKQFRQAYTAQARLNIHENALDEATAYAISSTTDGRYGTPQHPARVGRTLVGTGDVRVTGGPEIDYHQYSYINFPAPMRNGHTYTVTVRGQKRVTFKYDNNRTISRAIKINQVGYLSDAPRKIAYLGCHIYGVGPMECGYYPQFQVINAATGSVAFTGNVRLRERDAHLVYSNGEERMLNGEDVYELDFTGLTQTGEFFIRVPGVGRSWPFKHGADAYGEAFYTSARALYHQRCGTEVKAPYTQWPRMECHTDPVYESELVAFSIGEFDQPGYYDRFDIVGATLDESKPHRNVRGGWHDAADWDRNTHHYTVIFDLLYAYELAPGKFTDGQLNIPESGNGIPDVLDEALYGLLVWARSMNSDGGVSGFVETRTHPTIDADFKYAFSQRTRWDSLQFAAAAAQLAEHLMPFDERDAQRWLWRARKAYSFGNNPANSLGQVEINARTNRGLGTPYTIAWEEKDKHIAPFLLHARLRLYRMSGKSDYLEDWDQLLSQMRRPFMWPYTTKDYAPWIFYALSSTDYGVFTEAERESLAQTSLLSFADKLVGYLEESPYRRSWRRNQEFGIAWGVSDMTNAARALFIAYTLTGEQAYRDAAILNMDYMFGANPLGMSWTTGLGYSYPVNLQHAPSVDDGIADPVPGITIYGITGGMYGGLRENVWRSPGGVLGSQPVEFKVPEVPLWRSWSCHPTLNVGQCEFTIHETVSSTIFCTGFLTPDGWQPSSALKAKRPRPLEALHGYYYLP